MADSVLPGLAGLAAGTGPVFTPAGSALRVWPVKASRRGAGSRARSAMAFFHGCVHLVQVFERDGPTEAVDKRTL